MILNVFRDCAKTCLTASALSLSMVLFLPHRPCKISYTVPLTSNIRILVIVIVAGDGVPNSTPPTSMNVKQNSPLPNNTSVITYGH